MLRDQLRLHTQAQHERIEVTLNLPASVRNHDDYARLLGAFYGFYVPLETALLPHEAALSGVGVKLSGRRKAHKVRADLESLRVSGDAIDELALCPSPPMLPTWRHALGSLYVMEGATLGGQVIARHLRRHLDLQAVRHLRFFSGYGARTGTMWRAFVAALNALNLAAEDTADVLQGARETFEALERWMAGRRS
jgi:heme oxygenase (biliverdin-IX-beta and delta-forming)